MIKITAKTVLDNGRTKTCSFQTKQLRPISFDDIVRIIEFSREHVSKGREVKINYSINYQGTRGCIAGMNSKTLLRFPDRYMRQIEHMISSINSNV